MAANTARGKPKLTPTAAMTTRKPRRVMPVGSRELDSLLIFGLLLHGCRRFMNRRADTHVSHAAPDVATHHRIDIGIGWIGEIAQQRGSLHDLAGLTVTALRYLMCL